MDLLTTYFRALKDTHQSGEATEHSYRPALKTLLEGLDKDIQVINEPKRENHGATDFTLYRATAPIAYLECKDLGADLTQAAESEQLQRYRRACDNLILSNYSEFRWYRGGEWLDTVCFAQIQAGQLQHIRHRNSKLRHLLERFLRATPQDICSPDELAQVMATLTAEIAAGIRTILAEPNRRSFLHKHKHELESELLPALDDDAFADMYAQTLAYALFAARMENQQLPAAAFTLERAFRDMPSTNPFLKREFTTIFADLEREVRWSVEQLAARLAHTDIGEVMRDFRSRSEQRDAVVHFYEDFLAKHDPAMREQRGVYFTPEPVVGYIVRSVHQLLQAHFGCVAGLAEPSVHILDPASGTGSFLLRVVEQIHQTLREQGQQGIWKEYVRERLLPRLHGFELLMAPYTLAHMRLGLHLSESGFQLGERERLGIYLTNSLDKGEKKEDMFWSDHITAEANAAAAIKNEKPIMVVLGNPPYSGHSANKGEWIRDLLRDYYFVDGVRIKGQTKWLQDDYVKFIRFGQWRIARHGEGVLAFITNHGFLENITFRGMRQQLMNAFSEIYLLDLHGNSKKKETTPDGNKDENVFDIQQGVSIAIFIKEKEQNGPATVHHKDVWGLRSEKYRWLNENDVNSTDWQELTPQTPYYFFRPFDRNGWDEYQSYWKVTDIFPIHSTGVITARDKLAIGFTRAEVEERVREMCDTHFSDVELLNRYGIKEPSYWNMKEAREALREEQDHEGLLQPCLYRPFDLRHIIYSPAVVHNMSRKTMKHMLEKQGVDHSIQGCYLNNSPAQPSPAQPSPAQPSPAQPSPAQPSPARTRHLSATIQVRCLGTYRHRRQHHRKRLHLQPNQRNQLPLPTPPRQMMRTRTAS